MERTNNRTTYTLSGEIEGFKFRVDVNHNTDNGTIGINGTFYKDGENANANGNYEETVEGAVTSHCNGHKAAVDAARAAFPQLVEQERAYIASR